MLESKVTAPLAFSCTHCALELTVPPELAGIAGPCPGCGQTIQSPSLLIEPEAPHPEPVSERETIKGRSAGTPVGHSLPRPRRVKSNPPAPVAAGPAIPQMEPIAKPHPAIARNSGRIVHPVVCLSSQYDERREAGSVVRIALAVLFTLVVVVAVTIFLTR